MIFNSESELIAKAKSLKGKTIDDLLNGQVFDRGKGAIGNIIERNGFGIANNNDASPDFKNLGIELKIFPLKKLAKGDLTAKERTKICSINYKTLVDENWKSSHARNKLNKILFVFYYYDKSFPGKSTILNHLLFQIENSEEPLLKDDWENTKSEVKQGRAHLLSESQNKVLAASRSGAGKIPEHQWPDQPVQTLSIKAKQRAFSLKPSFTKTLWIELTNKVGLDSINKIQPYNSYIELENIILSKLNIWEGKTLEEFSKSNNIKINNGKSANALLLRTALGFTGKNKGIKEILQLGLTVKTIPVRPKDKYPFQAMSFPKQDLAELRDETRFDESEFYTYLQGFLFIPLFTENAKEKDPKKITIGHSFIWRPAKDDLLAIQLEWEKINKTVKDGIVVTRKTYKNKKGFILENNLPNQSETKYIHMRPHARDSNDIDKSIPGLGISKQCFWFNKSFIQSLIL
jgi:DNA mismatch repair protein MutH